MNTMTYHDALLPLAGTDAPAKAKRGFFQRVIDAIAASNAAKAERELRRLEAVYGISLRHSDHTKGVITAELPFSGLRD